MTDTERLVRLLGVWIGRLHWCRCRLTRLLRYRELPGVAWCLHCHGLL